ncbi:Golgi CORVET complex core vacuolar protein 8-domain-containing protein [Dimargaris cristalligena]|uniref:Golgi CORVET complex core vacuolar protein 8-domain-containing protein n=1 Tax=Dimargaris cristalligena TaxID=215637 RepID=A0A4P9ZR64_9FUNG|nr:Golgi CORVET complex core vacuolar protein 8-domain-containing protein [Dimargaris cristalligena]|eukprot:RKP35231.1 Golgi CORVET complex core vacuolar protein 8-domain-containing protein [Dimargaris cristalligena]
MVTSALSITYGIRPLEAIVAEYRRTVIPEPDLPAASPDTLHAALTSLQGLRDELEIHLAQLRPASPLPPAPKRELETSSSPAEFPETTEAGPGASPLSSPLNHRYSLISSDALLLSSPSPLAHVDGEPSDPQQYRRARQCLDAIIEDMAVYRRFTETDLSLSAILAEDANDSPSADLWLPEATPLAAAGSVHSDALSAMAPTLPESPAFPSSQPTTPFRVPSGSWEGGMDLSALVARLGSPATNGSRHTTLDPLTTQSESHSAPPEAFQTRALISDTSVVPAGLDALRALYSHLGHPTALAVSTHIFVGTSFGFILVYANRPDGTLEQVLTEDDPESITTINPHGVGAVTTLAVSPDRTCIAAGYANGRMTIWEWERPLRLKTLHPRSWRKTLPTADPLECPAIFQLTYLGVGHSRLISVDTQGQLTLHRLTRGLLGITVDSSPIDMAHPGTPTALQALPFGTVTSFADRLGLVAILADRQLIIIQTKIRPRLLAQYPSPFPLDSPVAGCLAWFPAVRESSPHSETASLPSLAFAWRNRLYIAQITPPTAVPGKSAGGSPQGLRLGGTPPLWSASASPSSTSTSPADRLRPRRGSQPSVGGVAVPTAGQTSPVDLQILMETELSAPIRSLQWFNSRTLQVLDDCLNLHAITRSVGANRYAHCAVGTLQVDTEMAHQTTSVGASFPGNPPAPLEVYGNSIRCYKGRMYLVAGAGIHTVTLLNWSDRIVRLIGQGRYVAAIRCVTRFLFSHTNRPLPAGLSYPGVATGADQSPNTPSPILSEVTPPSPTGDYVMVPRAQRVVDSPAEVVLPSAELVLGLPSDPRESTQLLIDQLRSLMRASLNYVFNRDNGSAAADAPVSNYHELASACLEACLATGQIADVEYLFHDVYRVYRQFNRHVALLTVLEPALAANRIQPVTVVPPDVVHDFLDWLSPEPLQHPRLESLLLRLDPIASFDIDRVLHVCHRLKLDDLMIYTWNHAVQDFIRPLDELIERLVTEWSQIGSPHPTGSLVDHPALYRQWSRLSGASVSTMAMLEEGGPLRQQLDRILDYSRRMLAGQSYPRGQPWPDAVALKARRAIFHYWFRPRRPTSPTLPATTRAEGGITFCPRYPTLSTLLTIDTPTVVRFLDAVMELPDIHQLTLQPEPAGLVAGGSSGDEGEPVTLHKATGLVSARQAVTNALLETAEATLQRIAFYHLEFSPSQIYACDIPTNSADTWSWDMVLRQICLMYSFIARNYAQLYPLIYITESRLDSLIWFLLAPPLASQGGRKLPNDRGSY